MADLYISEYRDVPQLVNGVVPVPLEPAIATQKVAFTTSSQSSAFNAATRYVIARADADWHMLVGTNPTATANHPQVASGQEKHFAVRPNKSYKLAAYDGTS